MLDQTAPPQRLEQRVAEAQRHQVLHRLFAEVMIDAVDLLLGEHLADLRVDQIGRRGVVPERLFQHHARQRRHHGRLGQVLADDRKQIRRRREKEYAHELGPVLQQAVSCHSPSPRGIDLAGKRAGG